MRVASARIDGDEAVVVQARLELFHREEVVLAAREQSCLHDFSALLRLTR